MRLILALLVSSFCSAVSASSYPLIVGGILSPEMTAVAAIQHNGQPHCSASWIGQELLLTAAHCQPYVSGGWQILDTSGGIYKPTMWLVNKDYDESIFGMHDTMLIVVEPVGLAEHVHDIFALPSSDDSIPDMLVSAGYGRQFSGDNSPVALRSVVLTQEPCSDSYPGMDIPQDNLCYNSPLPSPAGTCSGDSGGPLFDPLSQTVYGVTSWGAVPCASGSSVFVGVKEHLAWIARAIAFAEQR